MNNREKTPFDIKLDPEEQALEDALPDVWENLPFSSHQEKELSFAKETAGNSLRKEAKINIRLTRHDVDGLRRLASREGLPYQTLIASILHKYVVSRS